MEKTSQAYSCMDALVFSIYLPDDKTESRLFSINIVNDNIFLKDICI
jgi:hypothetical protein